MQLRLTAFLAALCLVACGAGNEGTADPLASPQQPADAAPTPDAGSGAPTGPQTGMPCDVARVLAQNCAGCHGPTVANGAPNALVTRADLLATSPRGGTLAARSVARMKDPQVPMPPQYFAPAVSAADQALFESWVLSGLPGGACSSAVEEPEPEADAGVTNPIEPVDAGAGVPDAGRPDAGSPDAGSTSPMMDAGVACTTDTWASYGQGFFASTCTNCHHHTNQFTTRANVLANRGSVTSRISSGNMPEGSTLSVASKTRILRYLNCGVP